VIWLFADLFVISPRLWEKKLLTVTEKARENVGKRKRILLKTSAVCLSISLLFAVLLGIFVNIHAYTEQIVCHSFEEFKQFIETPMEYRGYERVTMLYEDDLNKDYPVYSFSDENGNTVVVFDADFMLNRANTPENLARVAELVSAQTGKPTKVSFELMPSTDTGDTVIDEILDNMN
jgi:hypothetical protein